MKQRPWIKWLAAAAALSVLALAGLLLALKLLFPPQKIKTLALDRLKTSLGRDVRIERASIGLGGASLEGVEISEVPDFAAGTFLKAGALGIRVRLLPLILKREIQVDKLSVERGRVLRRDPAAGTRLTLDDLRVEAYGASLQAPFSIEAGFAYTLETGTESYRGEASFDGDADPARGNLAAASLSLKTLSLTAQGLTLNFAGTLRGGESPSLEGVVSLPALNREKLKPFADVPDGVSIPALKGKLSASLKDSLLNPLRLDLSGDRIALKLDAVQSASGWTFAPSKLKWGEAGVDFSGSVKTPEKSPAVFDLSLKTNRLDLLAAARLASRTPPPGLSGRAVLDLRVRGTAAAPLLSGKAEFDDLGLIVSGQTLRALSGKIDFNPSRIAGEIKGGMNNGTVELDFDVKDYSGDNPAVKLNGKLSELDLAKLPASSGATPAAPDSGAPAAASKESRLTTSGALEIGKILHPNFNAGKTDIRWDLKDLTPRLSALGGTLSFQVGAGRFQDLALLSDKPLAKIVLMPVIILQKVAHLVKVPLFPKFDQVNFKEITGSYVFSKGMLSVKESHLDSSAAYAVMTGKADLGKDSLDLHVSTKLLVKQIAGPVGFKVRGSLADPKVSLDAAAILKQPAVEKVLDQGRDLLRGIFKR